jgi:serine phosphatase RsbU (regulator of sigma subunit)/pSer/pThr/pTyr-binding forkhead associated (FHA) protein
VTTVRPRFVVLGAGGRRVVPVDKPEFHIGRAADADLQIGDADVSRTHAVIVTDAGGYLLRDRSRTGTRVNGEPAVERRLQHGDEIEIGRSAVLMFLTRPPDSPAGIRLQPSDLRPIAALLESLRAMGAERVLDEVLMLVLDAAIETSGAERGFIMLTDASGHLEMEMARAADRIPLPRQAEVISRKIPEQVLATGEPAVVTDLLEGELATVHTGTVALGIRHILCVPLRAIRYVDRPATPTRGEARDAPSRGGDADPVVRAAGHEVAPKNVGVLYLDSRSKGRLLSAASRAEIEALAREAALAIENARLYQQEIEKARLDRELAIASRIQQALLPEPRRAGAFFEAVGASIPSRVIGGDFFDYQTLPNGAFGLAIGDITGKGPPAALLTALVQGLLAAESLTLRKPNEVIAVINRALLARPIESRFLSLFLSTLASDGRLEYCNAGQNPPLLFMTGGEVSRLETGGTLIGAFPQAVFELGEVRLRPGDTLVLYSDGVSEAANAAGEEFGEERITTAVSAVLERPPQDVLDALFSALGDFTREAGSHDDMTAVVLRYISPGGPGPAGVVARALSGEPDKARPT